MQTCQVSLCQLYTLFAAFFPAAQSLPWLVAASELSSELCAGRAGAGGCCGAAAHITEHLEKEGFSKEKQQNLTAGVSAVTPEWV